MASNSSTADGRTKSVAQMLALAVAATFLLIGVLGFIPGATVDYDSMKFAGHESEAELLGLFQISILHNIVHLLFGIVGFLLARTTPGSIRFLIGGGVVYALLWVYGIFVPKDGAANFVPLNTADNWLHLGLAVGMILLGMLAKSAVEKARGSTGARA